MPLLKRPLQLAVGLLACAGCAHSQGAQGYWVRRGEHDGPPVWLQFRDDQRFEMHLPGGSFEGTYSQSGNVIIMITDSEARCTLERDVLRCGASDAFERSRTRPEEPGL